MAELDLIMRLDIHQIAPLPGGKGWAGLRRALPTEPVPFTAFMQHAPRC